MNLTCIDIGNTEIDIATFNSNNQFSVSNYNSHDDSIMKIFDLNSEHSLNKQFRNIAISSVVPKIEKKIINKIKELNLCHFSVSHQNSKIVLDVESPNEVGNDRICNMKVAIEKKLYPAIIVDFGAATTYDVINDKGFFIGGVIAPGIDVSAENLFKRAAQLNKVDYKLPKSVIGKNTTTNLQSGIMYGAIDSINGMLDRLKKEARNKINHVILTGGFSNVLSPYIEHNHILDTNMTISGIKLIWEQNQ